MFSTKVQNFLQAHPNVVGFIRVFAISCVFGIIPGSWMLGVPLLFLYSLTKQRIIFEQILAFRAWWRDFRAHFSERLGRAIGELLKNYPTTILKGCATLFLIGTMSVPPGMFGIYGLYRYTNEEWWAAFNRCKEAIINFASGFFQGVMNNTVDQRRLGKIAAGLSFIVLVFYLSGYLLYLFIDLPFLAMQISLVSVGLFACVRDLWHAIKQPWATTVAHAGKMLGVLWGKWLAYELAPGRIVGSLGPAWGQVETQGLASGLTSGFLQPHTGWFTFQTGILSYFQTGILSYFQTGVLSFLFSRIGHFFNNLIAGIGFSYNMKVWGDFQGYLGPTYFQVCVAMTLGCLIGWGVEKFVDDLFTNAAQDAEKFKVLEYVHAARWHLAFIASSTPILLLSKAGSMMFALSGGGVIAAAALTAASMAATFGAIYGTGYAVRRALHKEQPIPELRPEPPLVEVVIDLQAAPRFTPGFQQAQQSAEAPPIPPTGVAAAPRV